MHWTRIDAAIDHAFEAFWAVIADAFPENRSGDMPPEGYDYMTQHGKALVNLWLDLNTDAGSTVGETPAPGRPGTPVRTIPVDALREGHMTMAGPVTEVRDDGDRITYTVQPPEAAPVVTCQPKGAIVRVYPANTGH